MNPKEAPHPEEPWDLHPLVPSQVHCHHHARGSFAVTIDGTTFPTVVLTQAFPRSQPGHYVALATPEGKELGILVDSSLLDPSSRAALQQELRRRYVMPIVTQVERVQQRPGSWTFDLATDRGPMQISVRNLHEHLEGLGADRIILTDIDGRTAEVSSIRALDAHSQRELSKIL